MEDGTTIALADGSANYLRWRIAFQDLSDLEANSLRAFFAATQGSLQPFLFLDPTTNLLLWSEDFTQPAWQTAGVTLTPSIADPFGGSRAYRVHNLSSADQTITQDTQIPGLARVCFSIYLRTITPAVATLGRSAGSQSQSEPAAVTSTWQRYLLSGSFPATSDASRFGITVPAGASLDIFGPQLDPQVNPSPYVTSLGRSAGVYAAARLDMKQIDVMATGPNRNTCAVYVRCNIPVGE